jgi:hypothetical protein
MSVPVSKLLIAVATFVALSGTAAVADGVASTNGTSISSFDGFKIISDRNIFNQNRAPGSTSRDQAQSRPAPVIHALSLVGTMSYEKGTFAFFDGTRSEYKKPMKAGEKIAGYEIKEIQPNGVKIANETNQFELKVGQQLRREDDAEWQISTSREAVVTNAADATSDRENPASASVSGGAAGGEDEALKRLMEKRAKELNQ